MDKSVESSNDVTADDIGILSAASRREFQDISSNAVLRTPEESESAADDASSEREDGASEDAAAAEADPLRICAEEEDNLHVVLAMNEAMGELIDIMIEKAETALRENLEKQKVLEERKKIFNSNAAMVKRKVPVTTFMPPYFKDQFNMCPPQNAEMKRKLECMIYDPLLKEDKKWSENDLLTLHRAVKADMIESRLMPIYGQRDLVQEKVREANATTTPEERDDWTAKLDQFSRKIDYLKNLHDKDVLNGAYDQVDWATIAMVNFKGQRTPSSLRLKWCNEQCPQISKDEWTASEVKKLNELANRDFISWTLIASQLGTRRTAWQCFEKYKSEISSEILKREWTAEEDDRLVKLVESLQLNGVIQWDKVTYHMAGRTRQQCRTRYMRTLDKSIKHGRWTDEEDLLLMCSIGRYGAKDWRKVARGVPGRNDGQCRERWVNVLDRANRTEEWTMEEDEKLLYAVNMFGKGHWAKISTVLPGRNQRVCKARFRSLLTTKMRICAAQLSKIREAQSGRGVRKLNHRSDSTFKEFNQLVGGDDETGESFCDRARSVTQAFRWKRPEPEVQRVLEEGMQGISKKYEGRERRWSEMSDDSHVEELFNGIEQSEQRAAIKQQHWLPVDFDPDVTEADKCQRLTEALCQVIGKQDQLRSVNAQEAYESRTRIDVAERLKRILIDAVESRVHSSLKSAKEANDDEMDEGPSTSKDAAAAARKRTLEAYVAREMRSSAASAANDMMHPTAVTAHAAELLIAELPRISAIADPLLQCLWSGEKPSSMEEVMAHLEDSLKHHKEYLQLRELLRCLLVEPLMLIYSLEDDDRKKEFLTEEYNRARDQLMGDVKFGLIEEPSKPTKAMGGSLPKSANKTPVKSAPQSAKKQRGVGRGGGGGVPKEEKKTVVVAAVEKEAEPTPAAAAAAEKEVVDDGDEEDTDHEEFPMDWKTDTVVKDTVAEKKKEQSKKPTAASTTPAKSTPAKKAAAVAKKAPASAAKRAATPAKKTTAGKRKAAEMEEVEEQGEGEGEGEEEEAEAVEKPRKKVAVKRSRSRTSKSATPATSKDTVVEEQDEEEEQVVVAKTPAKKGKARSRKSTTPARGVQEEDTVDEEEVAPPVKRGRSTRSSVSTTPAREIRYKDASTAEEEEEEEEVVVAKPPPAKKGRATRNSLETTLAEEMAMIDAMCAASEAAANKARKEPAKKKGRTTPKPTLPALIEEPEEDTVAPPEDTVDGRKKDTVDEQKKDTVGGQKTDTVVPQEDTVDGQKKDTVAPSEDTVDEQKKDTVAPSEDTVVPHKETLESQDDTTVADAMDAVVEAVEDTVDGQKKDDVPADDSETRKEDTVVSQKDTVPADEDSMPSETTTKEDDNEKNTVSGEKDKGPAKEDTVPADEEAMDTVEGEAKGTASESQE